MEMTNQYHFGPASNKAREEAIALHRMRYEELGFFKNGEEDPYEKDSLYFVGQETTFNQVVGVTRLIFKPMDQLPTIKSFEIYDIDYTKLLKLENHRYVPLQNCQSMKSEFILLGRLYTTRNKTGSPIG